MNRGEEAAMRQWDKLMALKRIIGVDSTFVPRRPQLHPEAMLPDTLSEVSRKDARE